MKNINKIIYLYHTISIMKLFGPKSLSHYIHLLLKFFNYIIAIYGTCILILFLFAGLDYLGIKNPIAGLEVGQDNFLLQIKLFDVYSAVPIAGIGGFLFYVLMVLFGIGIYFFLTRYLSRIFLALAKDSIFVSSLAKNTRWIALLIFVLAFEKIRDFFVANPMPESVISDMVTLIFIGTMIWFLSKVFEEGTKIQQEIDLTI